MTGPIVIATGGTGGHMFPALALARELQQRGQQAVLLCDARGARYLGADVEHHLIQAGSPSGRPLRRLQSLARLARGLAQAVALLRRRRAAAVAAFGGYASVPVGLAARLLRIPLLVHEQNAILGRANRLIARRAAVLALSFAETEGAAAARARTVITGNPVRADVVAHRDQPYTPPEPSGPLDLLVVGGSQGARLLSEVLPAALKVMPAAARARIRLAQQCRPEDLERVAASYAALGFTAELRSFFDDLPQRLADAHLVISRSGASSVAELLALGRPSLLVPYRLAADGHQRANAAALAAAGAAWLTLETELDGDRLAAQLGACLDRPQELSEMARRAHALGRPDAAKALADAALSLLSPPVVNLHKEALA
jgi:UDP-N-acetylglucosamine--N-acetylmuramyl-(pentapeptide) pyrophosphoryl-undecaprenol N-acetylglucosamine transferase